MTGEYWARGSFAHSATVWACDCAHDYCGDRHWKMPRPCGVGPERCCYDYDDDYCSTPGKPLRHFCIRRRRKMNTCLVLDEQYCYWKMPRGGGCGDGDDYEESTADDDEECNNGDLNCEIEKKCKVEQSHNSDSENIVPSYESLMINNTYTENSVIGSAAMFIYLEERGQYNKGSVHRKSQSIKILPLSFSVYILSHKSI